MSEYMKSATIVQLGELLIEAIKLDRDERPEIVAAVSNGVQLGVNVLVDIHRIAASLETLAYVEHMRAKKEGII